MLTDWKAINPHDRLRLVREETNAGQLDHPNIMRISDIGQYESLLYLVMEYLDGGSLDRILKSPLKLALENNLTIMIELVFRRQVSPIF